MSVIAQDKRGKVPNVSDAELWAEELGLSFPVLADIDGDFYPVWDPRGVLPIVYIIDQDGVITWAKAGGSDHLAQIEVELERLLDDEQ